MNKFIRASMIAIFLLIASYSVMAPVDQAYATATLMPPPFSKFFYPSTSQFAGQPLSGGQIFTYAAGTTTPLASYTDSTATVQNTNPVILDSNGQASIWISGAYKIVVEDSSGNNLWTTDNVQDLFTYDNIQSTSTTSLAIQNGSPLTLTTQSGKYYGPGVFVMITNAAAPTADYMHCPITSYVGTQLTCTPDGSLGSGTFSSWLISLSGPLGPAGPTGPTGGSGGDMVGASNLLQGVGGVANVATARTNLGLGSAALLNAGTGANQVVQLNSSSQIPAVDGSLITGILKVSSSSIGATGYVQLSNGLIFEWGNVTVSASTTVVTFPLQFPNGFLNAEATYNDNGHSASTIGINTTSTTSMTVRTPSVSSSTFFWFAIGD